MSSNLELARIFEEMSRILELTGANVFRINAYQRAAGVLRELNADVAGIADQKKLEAIEGIGSGTARRILQYLETGHVQEHDKLLAAVPVGLVEVMAIPGLGPRTVKMLWEKAGVTDLESLESKLAAGELQDLPRMGAKTIENIRSAIAFAASTGDRTLLGEALPLAEAIVAALRAAPGARRVEYAGSLRRGRETIGDIDVLAAASDAGALRAAFTGLPGVSEVLAAGETKCSIRLHPGIQVDLRVVAEACYGAALMYFTGSKAHNVAMRERARKRKLTLSEYGLSPLEGGAAVAGRSEKDVFAALELPWIPPELRENHGELRLTRTPRLIEAADLRAELHAHTVASDGRMTIEELAEAAKARGLHTVAVTDHSRSSAQAGGLSPDDLRRHIDAVREADCGIDGITILAGSEVDIHADGTLDYEDELLAELDIVVASPHASLRQDPATATKRLVAAARHPLVHVLGHPTGRLINRRDGLHPDITELAAAAAEARTALEINAHYYRLDLRDVHVRAAVGAGALVAIDTDAHAPDHLDLARYGVLTARRGWLTPELCVNAWTARKLHGWLKSKR